MARVNVESLSHFLSYDKIDLSNSYTNYHVRNMFYLCLARTVGFTCKLYRVPPLSQTDTLEGLEPPQLMAPHSHPYNQDVVVLSGQIHNMIYDWTSDEAKWEANPIVAARCRYGFLHNHTGGRTAMPDFRAWSNLRLTGESQMVRAGDSFHLNTSDVHTYGVSEDKWALVMVLQYNTQPNLFPWIFLPSRNTQMDFGGLYTAMTNEDAVGMIEDARRGVAAILNRKMQA